VDNEAIENSLFGIHYSLEQISLKLERQEEKIDYLFKCMSNIEQGLSVIQAVQQELAQINNNMEDLKTLRASPELVLSPKTQVVLNPHSPFVNKQKPDGTIEDNGIIWDKRKSDDAPESTFGFKIPNFVKE